MFAFPLGYAILVPMKVHPPALNIPSVSELVEPLKGLKRGELELEAKAAGMAFNTLWKLVTGRTPNPRIGTARKLADYLKRRESPSKGK